MKLLALSQETIDSLYRDSEYRNKAKLKKLRSKVKDLKEENERLKSQLRESVPRSQLDLLESKRNAIENTAILAFAEQENLKEECERLREELASLKSPALKPSTT